MKLRSPELIGLGFLAFLMAIGALGAHNERTGFVQPAVVEARADFEKPTVEARK